MNKLFTIILLFTTSSLLWCQTNPSEKEMKMISEINFARTNPSKYAKFIPQYLDYWNSSKSERKVAAELVHILKKMKPIDSLSYSSKLYLVAAEHAKWMVKKNRFEHSNFNYSENLVAGDSLARFAVISLLIDYGVPSRGHRKNILNPYFKNVACFYISNAIEGIEHNFIQEFD